MADAHQALQERRPALAFVRMSDAKPYGVPVGEVLGSGFRLPPLLDGWTALEGLVLVKCLDAEGHSSWAFRQTEGVNDEEGIGALTVQLDLIRESAKALYYPGDDE